MKNHNLYSKYWLIYLLCILLALPAFGSEKIEISVKNVIKGAPITMGIPFSQGKLISPDHVRLLDQKGREIPSQITQVNNWEPLDYSVKWIWIFFFATEDDTYILEYGEDVIKAPIKGDHIKIKNAQRTGQTSFVDTGPLQFSINKRGGGFLDNVLLDTDLDGFDGRDTIAVNNNFRGSFLDLIDDAGIDMSKAVIHHTFREKGSGPMHAILRLEGQYTYEREDNRPSPFTIRIHLFAGKSYIKVYHTITYTGVPDKHKDVPGQHENIALFDDDVIKDDSKTEDEGWIQANDQIASTGLGLNFYLDDELQYKTAYHKGSWFNPKESKIYKTKLRENDVISVLQTGPKPNRIPPVPNSTLEEQIGGFSAHINLNGEVKKQSEKAVGWSGISDGKKGIAIGIRNFLEEYPKEIEIDMASKQAIAYSWSPKAGPMSFARASLERDQGMISNFAEGVTKTTESVLFFHNAKINEKEIQQTMQYILQPPVAHASSETYSNSLVYGRFSPRMEDHVELERSLDYKFEWQLFNQHWEPWYGMFDYGDQKNIFFRDDWYRWQNNEPAIDFMYWLQFMRTGEPKYFYAAEAMSRHTMDVDNVHWPTDPPYYGDTNESLDFWKWESKKSNANPYLGIGRRHARQHWAALLSAHVWLEGWLASYYLTGYHRGLDIAKLTADSFTRRIWGEHGLTGRRLYLSIWNLVEAWDATKDPKYYDDLKDRVYRAIALQNGGNQYDNLAIDRYGYSQIYLSQGLYKYYQLTQDEKVKDALIRHGRAVRDNPPYNHDYESYFSTIHSLLIAYEYTGHKSFLDEAIFRVQSMKTDKLKKPFEKLGTQKAISEALKEASNLSNKRMFSNRSRWIVNWDITQGLRVFGWTHIYNVPWLLYWIRQEE